MATGGHQTDALCDFAEEVLVDEDGALGRLLLAFDFRSIWFFFCLYCRGWCLIAKDIVFLVATI
jgi:hypothetical protein